MSTTITPTLSINLKGDTKLKVFERSIAWNPCEQDERILKINNTDGEQTIDLLSIDERIKLITISSDDLFVVKLTKDTNIVEQEVDLYVVSVGANYLSGIDSLIVYTNSTNKINIDIRVYGEVAA